MRKGMLCCGNQTYLKWRFDLLTKLKSVCICFYSKKKSLIKLGPCLCAKSDLLRLRAIKLLST